MVGLSKIIYFARQAFFLAERINAKRVLETYQIVQHVFELVDLKWKIELSDSFLENVETISNNFSNKLFFSSRYHSGITHN